MPQTKRNILNKKFKLTIPQKGHEEIENIPLKNLIYLSLVLNVITVAVVVIFRNHLPPIVPLYYGHAKSEAQLARQSYLILPSVVALSFVIINVFASIFFEDSFVKKALVVAAFVASTLATITVIEIVFLVGSF